MRVETNKLTRNVRWYTDVPESSIFSAELGTHLTYLDTNGRTSVVLKARNLVDEFRDREIYISYDYSVASALRKPLVIFCSVLFVFTVGWAIGGLDVSFAKKK